MTGKIHRSGHETNDDQENAIRPPYYHKDGIDVIKFAELFLGEQLIGFHRMIAEEYLRRLIEMEEKEE